MGAYSAFSDPASGTLRRPPGVRGSLARRLFATLPFAVAWGLAAATMNGALAPKHDMGDDLKVQPAPPPPAQSAPSHHDEALFDPTELISV